MVGRVQSEGSDVRCVIPQHVDAFVLPLVRALPHAHRLVRGRRQEEVRLGHELDGVHLKRRNAVWELHEERLSDERLKGTGLRDMRALRVYR